MHALKTAGRAVSSLLFRVNILLFAVFTPVVLTLGSPEVIKTSLSESGIYDHALSGAFESFGESESEETQDAQSAPANREALKKAADKALSPDLLENSANEILDGTYRWLNGEVEQPDFQINLTDAKETFSNMLADEAVKEVRQKPICTLEQLKSRRDINTDDPFELPCRPPDFSFAEVRQKISQEINRNEEFLADPVITAEDISSENENSIYNQKELPNAFQFAKTLPWIFGVLTLVFAGLMVLLHDNRRRAAVIISKAALTSGASLIVIALISNLVIGRINFGEQLNASAELKVSLLDIIQNLIGELNQRFIILGAILSAAGGGGLFYLHKTKPEQATEHNAEQKDVASDKKTSHKNEHAEQKQELQTEKETEPDIKSDK